MYTVVIPALNEAKTIGICVEKALRAMRDIGVDGEVLVIDNGSTDETVHEAMAAGAKVVEVKEKGYGAAYRQGIPHASGDYIIIGDADDSYNFEEIGPFIEKLEEGYEFVIGNRFKGKIEKGAMPWLHRYIGTPILTGIMNLFFKVGVGDTNCGMRAFTKAAFNKMKLKTSGMEFATEMVIKASVTGLRMCEIPCNLYRDKRSRAPHLNTWKDGWRYLRFMLLFAPFWTYFVPGMVLMLTGIFGMLAMLVRDIVNPAFLSDIIKNKYFVLNMIPLLVGSQILSFGMIAQSLCYREYYSNVNKRLERILARFKLEKWLAYSLITIGAGVLIFLYLIATNYLNIGYTFTEVLRDDFNAIATTLIILGTQIFYTAFVLSINKLKVV